MVSSEDPVLVLEELRVGYDGAAILPPLSCAILPGEVWALIGRNGSGKTTLLRTLLGMQPAVGGTFRWPSRAKVSYVAQREAGDLSVPGRVLDVVKGGLDRGWTFLRPLYRRHFTGALERALHDAECAELVRQQFAELSEGQKQRVLIARALVSEPELIVLDEPTSAMDPMAEASMLCLLRELQRHRRLAVIVASHQLRLLPEVATHAIFVDRVTQEARTGAVADITRDKRFEELYGAAFEAALRAIEDPTGPVQIHTAECEHGS